MKEASTNFPEDVTSYIQMGCMRKYQRAILDASRCLPCGLCGGLFQEGEVVGIGLRDNDLQYFLQRTKTAPDCCAVKDDMVSLCSNCNSAIAKQANPSLSAGNFVNCLFCQDYPEALKNLNTVEEAFIARAHVVCIFLKLTSGAKSLRGQCVWILDSDSRFFDSRLSVLAFVNFQFFNHQFFLHQFVAFSILQFSILARGSASPVSFSCPPCKLVSIRGDSKKREETAKFAVSIVAKPSNTVTRTAFLASARAMARFSRAASILQFFNSPFSIRNPCNLDTAACGEERTSRALLFDCFFGICASVEQRMTCRGAGHLPNALYITIIMR